METIYIEEKQRLKPLQRNQAFWKGEIEEGPLMWVTAPGARPSRSVPEPASEEELWTNVDCWCLSVCHWAFKYFAKNSIIILSAVRS